MNKQQILSGTHMIGIDYSTFASIRAEYCPPLQTRLCNWKAGGCEYLRNLMQGMETKKKTLCVQSLRTYLQVVPVIRVSTQSTYLHDNGSVERPEWMATILNTVCTAVLL